MAIPRFVKAFIKGGATAGVGMMAQQAKEDREDTVTDRNEKFELKKIEDRAKANRVTQLEMITLREENAAKALKRAEEKVISDTRNTLSGMGWQNNTLDYLESNQILNKGIPSFNLWVSQFEYDKPDFHIQSLSTTDGETISWQDDFLNQVNASKKTNTEISKENVDATLENVNGIPTNVVKSQTGDITGATTTTDTSTDTATDTSTEINLPAQTMEELNLKQDAKNNITAATSSTEVGASVTLDAPASWQDKWKEKQIIPQKVIRLGINDRGNKDAEALLGTGFSLYKDIPDDGTKVIKLTYDNASGTYNQDIVTVGQTLTERNNNLNTRQNQLMGSLLQQPFWGLTNEALKMLESGRKEANTQVGMSMTPENQVKFVAMQDSLLFLNDYYDSIGQAEMAAKLVSQVVKLYDITNSKDGLVTKTATDIKGISAKSDYEGIKLTGEMIVDDLALIIKIADGTPYGQTGLDKNNRNKVIQREINLYKSSLVGKTGNPLHGAMVDEILKSIERGNLDGNYWDEVSDDRDPSGTFEQGIDFDPTDEITEEQIEPTFVERSLEPSGEKLVSNLDTKNINQMGEFMKESMTSPDEFFARPPGYIKPKITVEFDGNVSNYDLSKIDVGDTAKVGARSGTSNINPNIAKFAELKKKIKILNQLEKITSSKGKSYRTKQIPILKAEIEAAIKELQGE